MYDTRAYMMANVTMFMMMIYVVIMIMTSNECYVFIENLWVTVLYMIMYYMITNM